MKFKKSFTLFLIVSLIISMQTLSVSGDQTPGALVVGSDELVTGISEISTEVPLEAPIQETTESVSSEALDEKKELPKRYIISYNTEYPSNPVINPATNSPQNALAIRSLKNTAGSRNVLNAHSEVVEFSSDDDI